jgi:hypothetical protein
MFPTSLPHTNDLGVRLECGYWVISRNTRAPDWRSTCRTPRSLFPRSPGNVSAVLVGAEEMLHFFQYPLGWMHNLSRYTHRFTISLDSVVPYPPVPSAAPPNCHHPLVYTAHPVTNSLLQPAAEPQQERRHFNVVQLNDSSQTCNAMLYIFATESS